MNSVKQLGFDNVWPLKKRRRNNLRYIEEKKHTQREQIYLDFLQNTGDVQIDQKEKKSLEGLSMSLLLLFYR